jgi:putative oxidoreductase
MSFSEVMSSLIGRLVLAWFFLSQALTSAHHWHASVLMLAMYHVPSPQLMQALSFIVMVAGSLALIAGFNARVGALVLFVYIVAVSVVMHPYWKIADAGAQSADYDIFARNIAIAGGLLILVGAGPGPFSVDDSGGESGKKK